MTTSSDWLAELRESKRQAIARAQADSAEDTTVRRTAEERLRAEQSKLAALIQNAQIEPLLQEFCDEILRGHPNFLGYSLNRTVRGRAEGSTSECVEPDPWTGPVVNNALSRGLDLGNGRYVSAVDWKLQSNYHSLHGHTLTPLRISVAATPTGIRLDGKPVPSPTADGFKGALLDTFKTTLRAYGRRRSHRHYRPWYLRFRKMLFLTGKLSPALVTGSVLVLLLSMVLAVHIALVLGLRP